MRAAVRRGGSGVDSCAVRSFWNRPLGSKLILLLSLALLVEMLAPWQRVCAASGSEGQNICGWRTAYSGSSFGTYAGLLAAAILVWELLPVLAPRLSMRGWPTAVVTAILGVALAICVLVKMIDDNEFQTVWAWIGLALALALMFVALIRVRYRWGTRGERRTPPEPPPPEESRPPRAETPT
jgi:hypothetical protein